MREHIDHGIFICAPRPREPRMPEVGEAIALAERRGVVINNHIGAAGNLYLVQFGEKGYRECFIVGAPSVSGAKSLR